MRVQKEVEPQKNFEDIPYGDAFKWGNELYIKLDCDDGGNLQTGETVAFSKGDKITHKPEARVVL